MATGEYSIEGIPVGAYRVTASKRGYITQEAVINVVAGETTVLDFQLTPSLKKCDQLVVIERIKEYPSGCDVLNVI